LIRTKYISVNVQRRIQLDYKNQAAAFSELRIKLPLEDLNSFLLNLTCVSIELRMNLMGRKLLCFQAVKLVKVQSIPMTIWQGIKY